VEMTVGDMNEHGETVYMIIEGRLPGLEYSPLVLVPITGIIWSPHRLPVISF
jgi:hypothetical protein